MNRNPEVDDWFGAYQHPLAEAMQRVREIILGADPRMSECVKWKSPTFVFEGNLASFNPRSKKHVSLMFHTGATIPGTHPRLEGGADTARYMRFADLAEVEAARPELEAVVHAWCALQAGAPTPGTAARTRRVGGKKRAVVPARRP
ncbi:DUF1801 domain-containing protein [Haliangium sp.]|uniref:DUF1801 domain-containing protein n=1 Tax=Haliangium sp. TaxID=2663208 RepID=UPI003D0CE672